MSNDSGEGGFDGEPEALLSLGMEVEAEQAMTDDVIANSRRGGHGAVLP